MSKERLVDLHVEAVAAWDTYLDMCEEQDVEPEKTFDEFVADYLLANGVIVPPCKVGDTVYVNIFGVETVELKVQSIEIMQSKTVFHCGGIAFEDDEFGKTVFLTREEAEKALRKDD